MSKYTKSLGQCVEPLTRPLFKAQGAAGSRLFTQWHQIVGERLAQRSTPQKLSFPAGKKSSGTLTIEVESGFATEIQHLQAAMLERLATYFGYPAVARIVISRTYQPVNKPKKSKPAASTPITTEATNSISDPELKAALESFGGSLSDA